jgi:hypothetical protein
MEPMPQNDGAKNLLSPEVMENGILKRRQGTITPDPLDALVPFDQQTQHPSQVQPTLLLYAEDPHNPYFAFEDERRYGDGSG